jgi:CubicO group peptidase (beta-lactamase class C family)
MTRAEEPFKDFDKYAKAALKDWKVPAMAVAVVKDGKVEFARGYGIRTLGGNDAVDADTVFPIASFTGPGNVFVPPSCFASLRIGSCHLIPTAAVLRE